MLLNTSNRVPDHKLTFDDLPDEALIRRPLVEAICGLKRATIYALAKKGRFPAPVKLPGGHASGWRVGDIRAVLADPTSWRTDAQRKAA